MLDANCVSGKGAGKKPPAIERQFCFFQLVFSVWMQAPVVYPMMNTYFSSSTVRIQDCGLPIFNPLRVLPLAT